MAEWVRRCFPITKSTSLNPPTGMDFRSMYIRSCSESALRHMSKINPHADPLVIFDWILWFGYFS